MRGVAIGRYADSSDPLRVGILVSGRGSNMEAIIRAERTGRLPVRVSLVLSNRSDAKALEVARNYDIPAQGRNLAEVGFEDYHRWLVDEIDQAQIEIVVLAGYMRILPEWVVDRYRWRILNIHPSLLPSFPGLHPHRQAIEHGVKVSGCTVHLVDHGVDQGPIVAQAAVPVHDHDTEETLAERILQAEHRLYPEALALMATGKLRLEGRRVILDTQS